RGHSRVCRTAARTTGGAGQAGGSERRIRGEAQGARAGTPTSLPGGARPAGTPDARPARDGGRERRAALPRIGRDHPAPPGCSGPGERVLRQVGREKGEAALLPSSFRGMLLSRLAMRKAEEQVFCLLSSTFLLLSQSPA